MWRQSALLSPQASHIVGAFQCMAGLWARESQHCPTLWYQIKRNLQARHWTWNKLLLLPGFSIFFVVCLISKVMRTSVWSGSLRLWVILCWLGVSLLLLPGTAAAFTLRRLAGVGRAGSGTSHPRHPHCLLGSETQCVKRTKKDKNHHVGPCGIPICQVPLSAHSSPFFCFGFETKCWVSPQLEEMALQTEPRAVWSSWKWEIAYIDSRHACCWQDLQSCGFAPGPPCHPAGLAFPVIDSSRPSLTIKW